MTSAPRTSIAEMDRVRTWILHTFAGAVVEDKTYHGQMRFSVPAHHAGSSPSSVTDEKNGLFQAEPVPKQVGISALFNALETNKDTLGFEYYSVSQTTLDQVFLSIVGKHNVEEENYAGDGRKRVGWRRWL